MAFVDRRERKGACSERQKREQWHNSPPDQMYIFEPPSNCSEIPRNAVPEWPFEASKACLRPGSAADGGDTVRSTSHCGGSMLTMSVHALQSDVVKCYLYWNGQMMRCMPSDVKTVLPRLFNMKWNNGQRLHKGARSQNEKFLLVEQCDNGPRNVNDIIEKIDDVLTDKYFAEFCNNSCSDNKR